MNFSDSPLDEAMFDDCPRAGEVAPVEMPGWGSVPKSQRRPTDGDYQFRKQRAEFKAICAARNEPCWLCEGRRGPVWFGPGAGTGRTSKRGRPDSFSLDHVFPVALFPALARNQQYWRCAHLACNLSRGAMDPDVWRQYQFPEVAEMSPVDLDW